MQLSPQTIEFYANCAGLEMIQPFMKRHVHSTGLSGGLGCAGYDIHLGTELQSPTCRKTGKVLFKLPPRVENGIWKVPARTGVLGVTKERFNLPTNVAMQYFNKSTLAREFVNAAATLAEPGWCGHLTLEIYNQTDYEIDLVPGQPIGQVVFHELDRHSETPYSGKYQNQGSAPVSAKGE